MLKITHIAHACFLIENSKERLIIDPYHSDMGYEPIKETVNYILISHNHPDHNCTDGITLKENIGSFKISTVDSFHDNENGNLRGPNIIHIIDTEDTRICHLGDLGHKLTDEQLKLMRDIDVLLIPVGGFYTIDYQMAIEVISQLNPMLVIPMHYKTSDKIKSNVNFIDNFIENIKGYKVIKSENNQLDYTKPSEKTVLVI